MKTIRYNWSPRNPIHNSSDTSTEGIRVQVRSYFVPDRSVPHLNAFFFVYRIKITNDGTARTRLRTRHWVITDGNGLVQNVRGEGVVGETPDLEPGQVFEYTSACPLSTRIGFMRGSYRMVREDGSEFDARIDEFALFPPGIPN